MKIKELLSKFEDAPLDRTLVKDLEIIVKVVCVPEEPLIGEYIKLKDETGELEAVAANKKIFNLLKLQTGQEQMLKLRGRLDKTEYGNIAFEIEEIVE